MSPVFRHGRLRLYLLRLLDEQPRHGYEVIRLLRDRFMGVYAPSPGTIYPRLARLEEEGLVTHDEENGRKVYRITEAGREELRSRAGELDELEEELSASVSDIVREVKEDVRETVRSLREELTWAAREMRRSERETHEDARDTTREQARQARETAWAQARDVREHARRLREQADEQARHARDQAKQARDQARGHAQRLREEAVHLRDDTRQRFRSAWEYAAGEQGQEQEPGRSESGAGESRESAGHHWGGWAGWGEWARWTDWPGRASWPGPRDMTAFHDLERLAKEFATDLHKVAWDSGALGGDVILTLRDILEDTLDRIRTEVFGQHEETGEETTSSSSASPPDSPAPEAARDAPTSPGNPGPAASPASPDSAANPGGGEADSPADS
jgi:DNA-binding PadR family transcriptional regulator